ncbi:hypothetical protein C8F04DRAFT_1357254 [Mycena alexandri]|uniref:Uncharacterized protein n=1 Tax=Mycena alexandri TaxID=1745969 RepID=A0AAD6X2V4_9AGAR|nr:hypothetical protein C8F04DRAFT_1357254 [Mycena alexandri]
MKFVAGLAQLLPGGNTTQIQPPINDDLRDSGFNAILQHSILVQDRGRGTFEMCFTALPTVLSLFSPHVRITHLQCHIATKAILEDLWIFAHVVAERKDLVDLRLTFEPNAFGRWDSKRIRSAMTPLDTVAQKMFHDVMYAMCAASPEVVFVDPFQIFSCPPQRVNEVHVRLLEGADPSASFALIVTNPPMSKVELGPSPLQSSALAGAELNRVLPHLALSHLTDMKLNTSTINPGVLIGRGKPIPEIIPSPIVPSLQTLASDSPDNLMAIMDTISPFEPDKLDFSFFVGKPWLWNQSRSATLSWNRLSTRTKGLKLDIFLWPAGGDITTNDIEGARLLHCVHIVKITGRVEEATKFLGWLRALPALKRLQVRHGEDAEWTEF